MRAIDGNTVAGKAIYGYVHCASVSSFVGIAESLAALECVPTIAAPGTGDEW